jgi:hypothetical protein
VEEWWGSGSKKELTDIFREQLWELEDGVDHLSHPPLHPYLQIWSACRKYGDGMTGQPALPSAGGWLDQDAELMLAFDIAAEILKEVEEGRAAREKAKETLANMRK